MRHDVSDRRSTPGAGQIVTLYTLDAEAIGAEVYHFPTAMALLR